MAKTQQEFDYRGLRKFNIFMGVLHLIQAGIMLLIGSNSESDSTSTLTTNYLSFDIGPIREAIQQGVSGDALAEIAEANIVPEMNNVIDIPLAPLVALFLFLSAVAHFYIASPGAFTWYKRQINKGINYVRWFEYAISSSVMIFVIAVLVGISDIPTLLAIFTLNALMNMFGLMMELHNQKTEGTNWTAYILGWVAGIVPWVIILMYFFGALNQVEGVDEGQVIPEFVYGIIASILIFFNSFAVNMYLQYRQIGPWKDYIFGERMYIVLSLVAKTALAWQVFFGTLRPF